MAAAHTLVLILKDFYQGFCAHLEALLSPWLLHSAPPTVTLLTVVTVLPESGSITLLMKTQIRILHLFRIPQKRSL